MTKTKLPWAKPTLRRIRLPQEMIERALHRSVTERREPAESAPN